jgi:hypothetical protein
LSQIKVHFFFQIQNVKQELDEQQGPLLVSTHSKSQQTCPTTHTAQPSEPSRQLFTWFSKVKTVFLFFCFMLCPNLQAGVPNLADVVGWVT